MGPSNHFVFYANTDCHYPKMSLHSQVSAEPAASHIKPASLFTTMPQFSTAESHCRSNGRNASCSRNRPNLRLQPASRRHCCRLHRQTSRTRESPWKENSSSHSLLLLSFMDLLSMSPCPSRIFRESSNLLILKVSQKMIKMSKVDRWP